MQLVWDNSQVDGTAMTRARFPACRSCLIAPTQSWVFTSTCFIPHQTLLYFVLLWIRKLLKSMSVPGFFFPLKECPLLAAWLNFVCSKEWEENRPAPRQHHCVLSAPVLITDFHCCSVLTRVKLHWGDPHCVQTGVNDIFFSEDCKPEIKGMM